MARTIQVDDNTSVGYDYEARYYYVTHYDTKTTRLTLKEAKGIIDVLHPDNTVTTDDLVNLYTEIEELANIYYALDDDGLGVKAIWFNTYNYYPIVYLGTQLRIGNTDIIHKVNNYTIPSKVVLQLHYFYLNTLGLDVPYDDLYTIYDYLKSHSYNMPVYNGIEERENEDDPYYYDNNLYTLPTSKVTYVATYNPDNIYNYTESLGSVSNVSVEGETITLFGIPTTLKVRDKVKLEGCNNVQGSMTYTNDGIYNVLAVNGKTITVDAEFTFDYDPAFSVLAGNASNGTITLKGQYTNSTLEDGDTFVISGGSSIDGTYTTKESFLNDDLNTTIIVYESVPADYEAPAGGPYPAFNVTNFPTLTLGVPNHDFLLNVTSTKYKDKFPVGTFKLDDFNQLVNYIKEGNKEVSNNIPVPTNTNNTYINSLIPDSIEIDGLSLPMEFKGTYSDLFIEEK